MTNYEGKCKGENCHYILKFEGKKVYVLCADCGKIKFEKRYDAISESELERLINESNKH